MQFPQPQSEHLWLQKFVGEWTFEVECDMGPGQPPMKHTGYEIVRSLGGLWIVADMTGQVPDMGTFHSVLTIGYDPAQKQFIGSFLTSVMTHLWLYHGSLDAAHRSLTLDTEGPSFTTEGAMAKFQDIYSLIDDNHRLLTSRFLSPEGQWHQFMKSTYQRVK